MPAKKKPSALLSAGNGGQMKLSFGQKPVSKSKDEGTVRSTTQSQNASKQADSTPVQPTPNVTSKKRSIEQISENSPDQNMITAESGVDDEATIGAKSLKTSTNGKKRLKKISDENDDGNCEEKPKTKQVEDSATANIKDKVTKVQTNEFSQQQSLKINQKKIVAKKDEDNVTKDVLGSGSNSVQRTPNSTKSKVEQKKESEIQEVFLPLKNYADLAQLNNEKWDPFKDSPQSKNQRIPFKFLVIALQLIEQQQGKNSRTQVVEIMTNIFRSSLVNFPSELSDIFYFFIVKLAPDFAAMETGIGHELSVKAVAKASGKSTKDIREMYKQMGDLGDVIESAKGKMTTLGGFFKKKTPETEKKALTFNHVFQEFRRIATISGKDSSNAKESVIVKLLQDGVKEEAKYIIRFLQKTLKTGAAEKTVITALARAIVYTPPNKVGCLNQKTKLGEEKFFEKCNEAELSIKQAICEAPDYKLLIDNLMVVGDDHAQLKDLCKITVGIPVKPMLAKPTNGVQVVLQRFEGMEFTCEYKYDGFRGQIHFDKSKSHVGKDVMIFSRNLENMTVAYPDVTEIIRELSEVCPNIENFILDSELTAYDQENDKILSFQTLAGRSRKHVNEKDLQNKVAIQAFDLLYLNGQSLLQETFQKRRTTLHDEFKVVKGKFMFAHGKDTSNFEDLETFLDESIKDCCEGLMVKTLNVNATYEPSKRSFNWLKLKKDYLNQGMSDTVDLVVIGADHGQGKRTGWFSSFLVACWNEDIEVFQSIGKVGTGFSDQEFTDLTDKLKELALDQPPNNVKIKNNLPQIKCDVYFEPRYVWEIKAADLSLSPMHTACLGYEKDKGIALRFPRFIRERSDKDPDDCTNNKQIVDMYRDQATVKQDFNDDDDFCI